MRRSAWVTDANAALLTDLYQFTMLQSYLEHGLDAEAVFELTVRRLPAGRNYLLACGLDDVLRYLETLRFTPEALDYLASLDRFSSDFIAYLRDFRFEGDVYAIAEGTPTFAHEPLLEVVAPLPQAQLVETFLLNQVHLQTLAASKAARVVEAAAGRTVVDFGLRHAHGTDAGLKLARAFFVAGVAATSNVLAGQVYGIPVAGTMAHSYVQAHRNERDAFRHFTASFPATTLLVDTYDTLRGVRQVVELTRELGDGFQVRAIRLDSGDLSGLAREARKILDGAGLGDVQIFASGNLDEFAIREMVRSRTPIAGFGVGTLMSVSADAPYLDTAYKLAAYAGEGRIKLAPGKDTLPGRKQVRRVFANGAAMSDVIGLEDETLPGEPLLRPVMRGGVALPSGHVGLKDVRRHARESLAQLPARVRGLDAADPPYPVETSAGLRAERDRVAGRIRAV